MKNAIEAIAQHWHLTIAQYWHLRLLSAVTLAPLLGVLYLLLGRRRQG